MKALIVGAAGQLGRALVATAPAGIEAIALPRAALDIGDEASVKMAIETHRPALIVNAAAYTAVDRAEGDRETAYRVNRDGPALLARLAAGGGIRLVHVGTDFVFDGQASSPYAPDHPLAPLGVYGASKAAGEAAVRDALPDALIVRTAWVYAADGANFLRTMLRLMRERPEVRVVADQIGTPTHATSLARAIWTLVARGAVGTHHFTDAGAASWYDFAVAIEEEALALGLLDHRVPVVPIRTADYPTPARRPAYSVLDKTATYAAIGAPAAHWREELRAALGELKEHHG
jgi:dTDP-4-dehydrorhamnose reductase